jgi:hypothetical protein
MLTTRDCADKLLKMLRQRRIRFVFDTPRYIVQNLFRVYAASCRCTRTCFPRCFDESGDALLWRRLESGANSRGDGVLQYRSETFVCFSGCGRVRDWRMGFGNFELNLGLDFGLNYGLDVGLDFDLNFGLDFGLDCGLDFNFDLSLDLWVSFFARLLGG